MPRLIGNKLYVEGNKLNISSGSFSEERWCTSKIVNRITDKEVVTKKGRVYVLEGNLTIRPNEQTDNLPIPTFILDKFTTGFPENWEQLMNTWTSWIKRQQDASFHNHTIGNSVNDVNSTRIVQTPESCVKPSITDNLSAILALAGLENSRFSQSNKTTAGSTTCMACPNYRAVLLIPLRDNSIPEIDTMREENHTAKAVEKRSKKGISKTASVSLDRSSGKRSKDESPDKHVARHSRSKQFHSNHNSSRQHETTMSPQVATHPRTKDYNNITIVNKKRNYNCVFL